MPFLAPPSGGARCGPRRDPPARGARTSSRPPRPGWRAPAGRCGSPAAVFPLAAAVLPFATAFGLLGGGTGAVLAPRARLALRRPPGPRPRRRRDARAGDARSSSGSSAALSGIGVARGAPRLSRSPKGPTRARSWRCGSTRCGPNCSTFYRKARMEPRRRSAATGAGVRPGARPVAWHLPGLVLGRVRPPRRRSLVYAFGRRAGLDEAPLAPGSFATFRTPLAVAAAFVPAGALAALADGLAARAAVDGPDPAGRLVFPAGDGDNPRSARQGACRPPDPSAGVRPRRPDADSGPRGHRWAPRRVPRLPGEVLRGRKRATAGREEGSKRNMSDVKVILTDEVRGLGNRGEVVSVAAGYARNFLLPKELALPRHAGEREAARAGDGSATTSRRRRRRTRPATVAKAFEGLTITVRKKAGEHDALYGSVTASDLAEALEAKGIKIDRRRIELEEPIKRLGTHVVHVRLHREVIADAEGRGRLGLASGRGVARLRRPRFRGAFVRLRAGLPGGRASARSARTPERSLSASGREARGRARGAARRRPSRRRRLARRASGRRPPSGGSAGSVETACGPVAAELGRLRPVREGPEDDLRCSWASRGSPSPGRTGRRRRPGGRRSRRPA